MSLLVGRSGVVGVEGTAPQSPSGTQADRGSTLGTPAFAEGTGTGELHVGMLQSQPASSTCHSAHISLAVISHETLHDCKGLRECSRLCAQEGKEETGYCTAHHTFEAASPMVEKFPK